jgi:hypothetical protein
VLLLVVLLLLLVLLLAVLLRFRPLFLHLVFGCQRVK